MLHQFRLLVGVPLPQLEEARSESWNPLALVSFEHHWFGTAASLLRGDMIGLEGEGVGINFRHAVNGRLRAYDFRKLKI